MSMKVNTTSNLLTENFNHGLKIWQYKTRIIPNTKGKLNSHAIQYLKFDKP